VILQDPATGLFVIPAGSTSKGPADLLSSQAMQDLVAQLRLQYDHVDVLALAAIADKIVMIVEWGVRRERTSPRRSRRSGLRGIPLVGSFSIRSITSGWRAMGTALAETTLMTPASEPRSGNIDGLLPTGDVHCTLWPRKKPSVTGPSTLSNVITFQGST